jgi:cell division protein DivIC
VKAVLKKIWFYTVKFKYPVSIVIFGVWITFIDETGLVYKSKIKKEIKALSDKELFYEEQIKKNEIYFKNLETNPEAKERLAREQYFMHKDNEDVFIIRDESKSE